MWDSLVIAFSSGFINNLKTKTEAETENETGRGAVSGRMIQGLEQRLKEELKLNKIRRRAEKKKKDCNNSWKDVRHAKQQAV